MTASVSSPESALVPLPPSDALEVRSAGGVQTWLMRLAPVNAINPDLLASLEVALSAAVADESVSAVVLASDLKVFSAGADARWMTTTVREHGPQGLLVEFNRTMDRFRELCAELRRSPLLIVAAIDGHTLAGGLELAAACDLRFAADNDGIQIGVPEMDLFGAMPSGGGGAQFLARLLGPSRALAFILDAKPITPRAAYDAGLVDRICPPGQARGSAERFAAEVATKAGRVGVAAAKRTVFVGAELPLDAALELDHTVHWDAMRRGNFLSGVDAFVERYG
jgi:enoyl-CoA hydratase